MNTKTILKLIQESYNFLFTNHKFNITFKSERTHPPQIRIGLESDLYNIKLLFIHEWGITLFISTLDQSFDKEDGWFNCERIVDFVLRRPLRWPPLELKTSYKEYLVEDMLSNGREFEKLSSQIFDMFVDESTIKQW
jgi:hypothetical protein